METKVLTLFSQIESSVCLYKSEGTLLARHNGEALELNEHDRIYIQKLRAKHTQFSWNRSDELPWFKGERASLQLNMEDEKYNQVLMLYFNNEEDQLKDILAICFPLNTTLNGIQMNLQSLDTDEKQLLGNLLHQTLQIDLRELLNEKRQLSQLNRLFTIKESASKRENDYHRFFQNTCFQLLENHAQADGKTCIMSEETQNYLAACYSDMDSLRSILEQSYDLAVMSNPFDSEIEITIHHVRAVSELPTELSKVNMQEQKASTLLNRYEEAAQQVYKKGDLITGKSVAQNTVPAISPPALSDSIKKHLEGIELLLKKYPYEWKLIRGALKPLREIDERDQSQRIIKLNA